jgi:predicted site-specific integrase-resolvase
LPRPLPPAADLVPLKDVCQRLGIHWNTGYRARRAGRFPLEVLQIETRYYCRRADLDAFVSSRVALSA